jgi:hypothetical protein
VPNDVADDLIDRDAHIVPHPLRQCVTPAERLDHVDDLADFGQLIADADFCSRHGGEADGRRYDTHRSRGT